MSATTTQLLSSGEFCKLRYDAIPVKSASANVSILITQKCQILSCDALVANERYSGTHRNPNFFKFSVRFLGMLLSRSPAFVFVGKCPQLCVMECILITFNTNRENFILCLLINGNVTIFYLKLLNIM